MSNPLPSELSLVAIANGDVADATPVESNFTSIQNAVNELVQALSGGVSGQRLQAASGTDIQWVNQITYRKTSSKQVVNTVAETDLLNGEITLGAGVLGTDGLLRLTASGDSVNNSGASQATPRFKVKLGATTLFDSNVLGSPNWTAGATRTPWRFVVEIRNLGVANSQLAAISGNFTLLSGSTNAVFFTNGEGVFSVAAVGGVAIGRLEGVNYAGAVDTTSAQALALTVTLPAANASLDMTLKGALVEIV